MSRIAYLLTFLFVHYSQEGNAAILNSLYFGGYGVGCGSAIFVSRLVNPSTMIIVDLVGSCSVSVSISLYSAE